MDRGELFNCALIYVGKPEYEAGTSDAELVEKMAQHCIALALDFSTWTFATRRARLAVDSREGFALLPADCQRLQKVHASRYELMGNRLYLDATEGHVLVDYTTNEYVQGVYLPDNQPLFFDAVCLLLASKIAPSLTSRFDLADALESKARAMLSKAKLKDARQWASNDQLPDWKQSGEVHIPVNVLAE